MVDLKPAPEDGDCCGNCNHYNSYRGGYCEKHKLRVYKHNYCPEHEEGSESE